MWFKKFFLLGLLVCGLSVNLYSEEKVAVSKADVSSLVKDIGEPTVNALTENITKLFGDVHNPDSLKFAKDLVVSDLSKLLRGVMTTIGVSFTQKSVEKTLHEVLEGTILNSKKKFTGIGKGIILGIIQNIAQDAIEKIVYKKTDSRILAGSAVALIEQSVIYTIAKGNLYAVLVSEAELVYTRYYGITKALYEIDKIQNQTAKNSFNLDLGDIQIKYSKEYSKNNDDLPRQTLLNRLNKEVDERVKFYSDEIDLSEAGRTFKNEMYSRLITHKLIYRYLALKSLKKYRDEIRYYNYLNNYFASKERWYYKVRYSAIVSPYSDVDIKSRVHQNIYILGTVFNMKYIASQIVNSNNEKLNPNEYVGGKELTVWLEKLIEKVEKIDGKSYDETKFLFIDGIDYGAYLSTISMSQIIHAFYKEVYGSTYTTCLSSKNRQSIVNFLIYKKLKELNYKNIDKSNVYSALKGYYSVSSRSLNKLKILSATYLNSSKYKRKYLIDFGVDFLSNHAKNKKLINSCKE
jgi:hypothetical protein